MWRREIKEQVPTPVDFTVPWQDCQPPEVLYKKAILKNFLQYPQETPVLKFICKKVADLQICNFIKKIPQHRCFPVNIAEFLILPILKNICKRLFFNDFNGSLLYGPKNLSLYCMKESGFRVRVTSLVFFKQTFLPEASPNLHLKT